MVWEVCFQRPFAHKWVNKTEVWSIVAESHDRKEALVTESAINEQKQEIDAMEDRDLWCLCVCGTCTDWSWSSYLKNTQVKPQAMHK